MAGISIGGTEIDTETIIDMVLSVIFNDFTISENSDSFTYSFDIYKLYSSVKTILPLVGEQYVAIVDQVLGALLGVEANAVGDYLSANNVSGSFGISFDENNKASFFFDAAMAKKGDIALTGSVFAVDNTLYTEEEITSIKEVFPENYLDAKPFNLLNIDLGGTIALKSADNAPLNYTWGLIANIDPFEYIINALETKGTEDAYSWFNMSDNSSFHFYIYHVHDENCGAFCQNKYSSGNALASLGNLSMLYEQLPQARGFGYGKATNILDVIYAPKSIEEGGLGTDDILIDINLASLLGSDVVEAAFDMLGIKTEDINDIIGPLFGGVTLPMLIESILSTNVVIPLDIEAIARYIDKTDFAIAEKPVVDEPVEQDPVATALGDMDIGGIVNIVTQVIDLIGEAFTIGDNSLELSLDPIYDFVFNLLGDALADSGITTDNIRSIADAFLGGANKIELSVSQSDVYSDFARDYNYANAMKYNPASDKPRVYAFVPTLLLGLIQVPFANIKDRIVSYEPISMDNDGYTVMVDNSGSFNPIVVDPLAPQEFEDVIKKAFVPFAYTDASGNTGTTFVKVIGVQGVDMNSTEEQVINLITMPLDGNILNFVSIALGMMMPDIQLPIPGAVAQAKIKFTEVESMVWTLPETEQAQLMNVGAQINVTQGATVTYTDGRTKYIEVSYSGLSGAIEEVVGLGGTSLVMQEGEGEVYFSFCGETKTMKFYTVVTEIEISRVAYTQAHKVVGLRTQVTDLTDYIGTLTVFYTNNTQKVIDRSELRVELQDTTCIRDGIFIKEGKFTVRVFWGDIEVGVVDSVEESITVKYIEIETSGYRLNVEFNDDGTMTASLSASVVGNIEESHKIRILYTANSMNNPLTDSYTELDSYSVTSRPGSIYSLDPNASWTFSNFNFRGWSRPQYFYIYIFCGWEGEYWNPSDRGTCLTYSQVKFPSSIENHIVSQTVEYTPTSSMSGSSYNLGFTTGLTPEYRRENDGYKYYQLQNGIFNRAELSSFYLEDSKGDRMSTGYTVTSTPKPWNNGQRIDLATFTVTSLNPGLYKLYASFGEKQTSGSFTQLKSFVYDYEVTSMYKYNVVSTNSGTYTSLDNSTGKGSTDRTLRLEKAQLLVNYNSVTGIGTAVQNFDLKLAMTASKPADNHSYYKAIDLDGGPITLSITKYWWQVFSTTAYTENAVLLLTINGKSYIQPVTVYSRVQTVSLPQSGYYTVSDAESAGSSVSSRNVATFSNYTFNVKFTADISVDNKNVVFMSNGNDLTATKTDAFNWTVTLNNIQENINITVKGLRRVENIAINEESRDYISAVYPNAPFRITSVTSNVLFDLTLFDFDTSSLVEEEYLSWARKTTSDRGYITMYDRVVFDATEVTQATEFGTYNVMIKIAEGLGGDHLIQNLVVPVEFKDYVRYELAVTDYPLGDTMMLTKGADGNPLITFDYNGTSALARAKVIMNSKITLKAYKTEDDASPDSIKYVRTQDVFAIDGLTDDQMPLSADFAGEFVLYLTSQMLGGNIESNTSRITVKYQTVLPKVKSILLNGNKLEKAGVSLDELPEILKTLYITASEKFINNEVDKSFTRNNIVESVQDGSVPYDPLKLFKEQTVKVKLKGIEGLFDLTFTIVPAVDQIDWENAHLKEGVQLITEGAIGTTNDTSYYKVPVVTDILLPVIGTDLTISYEEAEGRYGLRNSGASIAGSRDKAWIYATDGGGREYVDQILIDEDGNRVFVPQDPAKELLGERLYGTINIGIGAFTRYSTPRAFYFNELHEHCFTITTNEDGTKEKVMGKAEFIMENGKPKFLSSSRNVYDYSYVGVEYRGFGAVVMTDAIANTLGAYLDSCIRVYDAVRYANTPAAEITGNGNYVKHNISTVEELYRYYDIDTSKVDTTKAGTYKASFIYKPLNLSMEYDVIVEELITGDYVVVQPSNYARTVYRDADGVTPDMTVDLLVQLGIYLRDNRLNYNFHKITDYYADQIRITSNWDKNSTSSSQNVTFEMDYNGKTYKNTVSITIANAPTAS